MLRRFFALSWRATRSSDARSLTSGFVGRSLLMLAAAAAAGCSSQKPDNRKAVFPVRGKLLVDQQPAPGALVILHPAGGESQAERPFGKVGQDGTFELTTYEGSDGAPAGEYIVTTEWQVSPYQDAPGPWPNALPEQYSDPRRSELKVTIAPGPNELQPFTLSRTRR